MTPIQRPPCPDYLLPYLATGTNEQGLQLLIDSKIQRYSDPRVFSLQKILGARYKDVRQLLADVFRSKCCYCESTLGATTEGEIAKFRPSNGVQSNDGKYSSDAYRQLSADWRNLYLACPTCNRNKANRFPLEGARGVPDMSYEEVVAFEQPLLLDPCRDAPDDHLAFLSDGTVAGITKRGRTTVDLLVLNRQPLVDARRLEVQRFEAESNGKPQERMGRQYEAVWRQQQQARHDPDARQRQNQAQSAQRDLDVARNKISTDQGNGLDNYRARAKYVDRVCIENFGAINKLDLDMRASSATHAPCFALLGNNGVGKSTVLRALALAMSGPAYVKRLRLSSRHFLPLHAHAGEVRVYIADGTEIRMTLRRNRRISFDFEGSHSLVVAYGSTRLLPRGRHKSKDGLRHAKIDNLFDPFLPLTDPSAWFQRLSADRLKDVNAVLASLLPDEEGLELIREDLNSNQVKIQLKGDTARSVNDLSDGFQSMLGMAVDVLQVMYEAGYESMHAAQGVVLIDELGNHFHPAWRLRAVSTLRSAFPYVQFIFSTHDPLCLRGLMAGEVAVLMRDDLRHIYALDDLPPVNRLRVEQLLSSEHFGLRSTVDPEMDDDIKRYENLSGKLNKSPEDEDQLTMLVEKLTDIRYLGSSRRERLALQLVDLEESHPHIASKSTISATNLAESTLEKLKRVMRSISPAQTENNIDKA